MLPLPSEGLSWNLTTFLSIGSCLQKGNYLLPRHSLEKILLRFSIIFFLCEAAFAVSFRGTFSILWRSDSNTGTSEVWIWNKIFLVPPLYSWGWLLPQMFWVCNAGTKRIKRVSCEQFLCHQAYAVSMLMFSHSFMGLNDPTRNIFLSITSWTFYPAVLYLELYSARRNT